MTPLEPITPSMLGWEAVRHSSLLLVTLVLAGAGTTVLFVFGAVASYRRRSTTYLLITLAIGALVVKTAVGAGTAFGVVPMGLHHLLTHGLDLLIAVLLLAAISTNGSP